MEKNKQQPVKNKNNSGERKHEQDEKTDGSKNKTKPHDPKGEVSRHPTTEPNPGG